MLKRKIVLSVLSLVAAIVLSSGTGIVADMFGYASGPAVYACSGGNGGGDC